ncbi:ABC transporter ATP-binding protein [Marinivivus vitaminiproducens]|uniref:ABC transporter ATP-binding protein n=1 Tax=Marinivivus vitaminiproducens TaxID=3035935 RepID=UPI00279820BD|nr:ABC transporter ATP-binding protein [Geminicoccaceae bacterium SCSIO 64248]
MAFFHEATVQQPFVRFDRVQKTYDGKALIVRDLNLDIAPGEFLTLLGPSGSGKTTSLMMLAGFEQPTDGHIYLAGRPIDRLPPHKRDIGVVFQNYALFPHMTVGENLAFPLSVRGRSKSEIEARVKRALDMVRLSPLHDRRPAQLSGGQQQRVAVARALVFEPKLVLMDEPLGALDKQLREEMQLEVKHIHERVGVTVVYVTHDQSEALTMSDRIAVFNDGVIQQCAAPRELYERPATAFVASFLGENNRLPGRIESLQGGLARVVLDVGGHILADPVGVSPGDPTVVSVRPERISLGRPEGDAVNTLSARVIETIYHGDHLRLRLALGEQVAAGDPDGFTVKLGPNQAETPGPGQLIELSWQASACRALAAA